MSNLNWPVEFKLARLISSRISKQSHGAWPRLQYVIVTIDEFLKLHQEGATEVKKIRLDWVGLNWNGLNWNGLDWNGLDWVESDWTRRYQPRLGNSQSHYIPRIQSVGCTSTLYSQMVSGFRSMSRSIEDVTGQFFSIFLSSLLLFFLLLFDPLGIFSSCCFCSLRPKPFRWMQYSPNHDLLRTHFSYLHP